MNCRILKHFLRIFPWWYSNTELLENNDFLSTNSEISAKLVHKPSIKNFRIERQDSTMIPLDKQIVHEKEPQETIANTRRFQCQQWESYLNGPSNSAITWASNTGPKATGRKGKLFIPPIILYFLNDMNCQISETFLVLRLEPSTFITL